MDVKNVENPSLGSQTSLTIQLIVGRNLLHLMNIRKRFTLASHTLKQHEKIHTGEKRYEYSECGKSISKGAHSHCASETSQRGKALSV